MLRRSEESQAILLLRLGFEALPSLMFRCKTPPDFEQVRMERDIGTSSKVWILQLLGSARLIL